MKTLFVTSFSPDLYEASGKRLLESFLAVQRPACPQDELLVCYEGRHTRYDFRPAGLLPSPLDSDPFLRAWLETNADIIPDYLGGTATRCSCPDTEERHAKHRPGCHWQWMNRNASRWFRKVASLREAYDSGARHVVWLDADAYFKAPLPHKYLAKKLARAGLFYFRGHRPGVESGILGFDMEQGGGDFVLALCRRYTSGEFRADERWDDGYQIARVLDTCPTVRAKAVDLVHPTRYKAGKHRTNNVIPTTDIAEFLVHDKGRHGTGLDIMK